ncbi:hypothetical protein L6164_005320 [Bauhinia variegata]|uniref:Uncharacterized protein n=1 Tax=Bauhinia variegata TaxID=167791 RepID=A0ACB9PQU4_BAUVA|nr:hypothetical protein L6164_005320 [Bauhinia variegata]
MEDYHHKRKRVADDSELDSPESKVSRVQSDSDVSSPDSELTRVNSGEACVNSDMSELARVNSDDSSLDSPGSREIQDNIILNILDDTDNVAEREQSMQGLDSVMKSFEEEIFAPAPEVVDPNIVPESGELQPNLGYLLEASDDELGLPPTVNSRDEERSGTEDAGPVFPEGIDFSGFMGFEDDMPNYESLGFGTGMFSGGDDDNNEGGFVTLDGLFDYAEPADILCRPESLQAM